MDTKMRLNIKYPMGQRCTFDVNPSERVTDIIQKLAIKTVMPSSLFIKHLQHAGKILKDDNPISAYNIGKDDWLTGLLAFTALPPPATIARTRQQTRRRRIRKVLCQCGKEEDMLKIEKHWSKTPQHQSGALSCEVPRATSIAGDVAEIAKTAMVCEHISKLIIAPRIPERCGSDGEM